MAQINAYSIYDRKALIYNNPFYSVADGAAVRIVQDMANSSDNFIGRHPGDYVLYRVGFWDDEKGLMIPLAALVHVVDVQSLVQVQPRLPIDQPHRTDPPVGRGAAFTNGEDA